MQKQINTVVQYITEAQAHGAEPLPENDDEHGIELSNVDHMNFGSDACSGTLRFGHLSFSFASASRNLKP